VNNNNVVIIANVRTFTGKEEIDVSILCVRGSNFLLDKLERFISKSLKDFKLINVSKSR
jgi:hypothetical protein